MHTRSPLFQVLIAGGLWLGVAGTLLAAKKPVVKSDPGLAAVEGALRAEAVGEVDRRERLGPALREHPHSAAAHWQSGFVRDGQNWRSFEAEAADPGNRAKHPDYLARRQATAQTFDAQIELAKWCRKQGLIDEERAYLFAAVNLDKSNTHPDVLERLGYRRVENTWLTPEQISDWRRSNERTEASLKLWEGRLRKIVSGLEGSERQRENARRTLADVRDPAAVPAVELVLAGHSEPVAELAVALLARVHTFESSLALAKQALFSPWTEVRTSATTVLKSRPTDEFVPALISLLATPVSVSELKVDTNYRTRLFSGPIVLYLSCVLARETDNQFQVTTLRTANYRINDYVNGADIQVASSDPAMAAKRRMFGFRLSQAKEDALRSAADDKYLLDRQIEDYNDQTKEFNARIGSVLAAVSGQAAASDPATWWKWWATDSDTQQVGGKQVVTVTEDMTVGNPYSPGVRFRECFAAGTPVWTEGGLVAIETIQAGDRVLAQDVESGELGYRPVLQVTVRPPKELVAVRVGDETIISTGGHRLWSSGTGWVKARDLTSQMQLHTATGSIPVGAVDRAEVAQTYNLVVADFHTFFVGKSALLCQDLLLPAATNNIVPGLSRQNADIRAH